ncbi:type VI secretion system baseplate subunit TssE [Vibrio sp. 10N]|uniref:type VI secretion system baseplate subunit TssE n=1 Tax=Vibrio sp. 10N TaxID=3058938 RepID=UPI002813E92C|nr:type VI secretion system baseplate subunit TssE [Vibrio sp. 10N]
MASLLSSPLFDRLEQSHTDRSEQSHRQRLRNAIRRDLEGLLNAKVSWLTWPEWYHQLDQSLLSFGLPDFSSMPLSSQDGRERLCATIEETIAKFEPRLTEVSVEAVDDEASLERVLKIKIHALCVGEYEAEPIVFDSQVEPVCLGISVSE